VTPSAVRERLPRRLVRAGVASPSRVLLGWLLLCMLVLPGLLQLSVETSTESVLDKAHPAWAFYQESLDLFGGDEVVVVALQAREPFAVEALRAVRQLSDRFEGLVGVRRVDSISTQPVIRVDDAGDLRLSAATKGLGRDPTVDAERVQQIAAIDRILPRSLVSNDGTVFAINLVLERSVADSYEGILGEAEAALSEVRPNFEAGWISGVPVFQFETSQQTQRELLTFIPLTLLTIGTLLTVVFRSLRSTLFLLGSGGVGNLLMLSAIGAAGIPLSFTMVILPPIVLALAAAYGMHLLTASAGSSGAEESVDERSRALLGRLEPVATPVALSGLTTAIGFLATSVIEIDAVRYVGAFGALGVVVVVALTLTALPACLTLWPLPQRDPYGFPWLQTTGAPWLARVARSSRTATVLGWGLISLVATFGIRSVEVDTDATRWFRAGTSVRDDYEAIRERLSGISPMNVVIAASGSTSVLDIPVLTAIDELSGYLEALPQVGKSVSLADPLRQLHDGFEGRANAGLPQTRALAEQYLLLLESVEQIDDLVTADREHANVLLRVDDNGSSHLLALGETAESWWREHGAEGTSARATGVMYEFGRAQDAIAWGQATGLAIAFACIGLLLLAVFRVPAAAGATLLPNIAPLLVIYGFMGFAGVPLDAGTVLVGSLALGIAVDDTVHLASAYYGERETASPDVALARALQRVLPAVGYTTVIVGVGFLMLALSDFSFIRNLGFLMGAVMTLCLAADVLLLPALLLGRRRASSEP